MSHMPPEVADSTFPLIVEFEERVRAIDALVSNMRQTFVQNQGQAALPGSIALLDELRWQLERAAGQVQNLEGVIGIRRRPGKTNRRSGKARQARSPAGIRGSTESLPIPDLVTVLSSQQKTGTLWIRSGDQRFFLEFVNGSVVHAVADKPRPDQRLGTVLVAQNKLSQEKLDEFLERYSRDQGRIGEVMARAEVVSESDLLDALEYQVRELFRRIFALDKAEFAFVDGKLSDMELRVMLNTTQLLLECARLDDEDNAQEHLARAMERLGEAETELAVLDGKPYEAAEQDSAREELEEAPESERVDARGDATEETVEEPDERADSVLSD